MDTNRTAGSACDVLLVDDDKDSREVTTRLLLRDGYIVETAWDCASALECARRRRFHVLIADVGLPDGNGLRLLTHIRDLYPIRGIVVSGYGMASDILNSQAAGFAAHLTKPITMVQLTAAIDSACDSENPVSSEFDLSPTYFG